MRHEIIHFVGYEAGARLPEGEVPEVRTRCGRAIKNPVVTANVGPTRYDLVARNGNIFHCTTRPTMVTCVKCNNLLTVGTIYDSRPSRPAHAAK